MLSYSEDEILGKGKDHAPGETIQIWSAFGVKGSNWYNPWSLVN